MENLYFQWNQEKGPKKRSYCKGRNRIQSTFFISCVQNQCCQLWVYLWLNYLSRYDI